MKYLVLILAVALSAFGGEKVFKFYTNDGKHEWCATAFFVGPDTLLTAAHTFEHTEKKGAHNHFILQDGHNERVTLLKIDYALDIALIQSNFKTEDFYRLNVTPTGSVKIVGFKGDDRAISETVGSLKKLSKWLELNCAAISGLSGGPMVNEDGSVSGMLVNGDKHKACGVPASKLLSFLEAPVRR